MFYSAGTGMLLVQTLFSEFPERTPPESLLSRVCLPALGDCRDFARKPATQAPASSRWSPGGRVVRPWLGWSPENPQTVRHRRHGARAAVLTQVPFCSGSEPGQGPGQSLSAQLPQELWVKRHLPKAPQRSASEKCQSGRMMKDMAFPKFWKFLDGSPK